MNTGYMGSLLYSKRECVDLSGWIGQTGLEAMSTVTSGYESSHYRLIYSATQECQIQICMQIIHIRLEETITRIENQQNRSARNNYRFTWKETDFRPVMHV